MKSSASGGEDDFDPADVDAIDGADRDERTADAADRPTASSSPSSPRAQHSQRSPNEVADEPAATRRRFELLDDTGFDEVPARYRRFYRRWQGSADALAPNEVLCPVCKVVIRSARELRPGDRVYCMPCMSRLEVVRAESGRLEAIVKY